MRREGYVIRQTLHCQEVIVDTLFQMVVKVSHHHDVPAAVGQHQLVEGLGEVLQRGGSLALRAVHGAQQPGRAVFQHYPEDHHLHLGLCVHFEVLGLHSLLKTYSYSAICSLMAVSPGLVGVATYFAKRGLHFTV